MKPAYFKGIQWTKIFVTGPLDPVHNKHKFYCQICKTNVSIGSKGAREIIRHYQSDAHLRKDLRWRFEHLGQIDKLTGLTVHAVRGKDGRVLSALDLEKEKPLFLTAPLVDIGPRFPFYEDYMAGVGGLKDRKTLKMFDWRHRFPSLDVSSHILATSQYWRVCGLKSATPPIIRILSDSLIGDPSP